MTQSQDVMVGQIAGAVENSRVNMIQIDAVVPPSGIFIILKVLYANGITFLIRAADVEHDVLWRD